MLTALTIALATLAARVAAGDVMTSLLDTAASGQSQLLRAHTQTDRKTHTHPMKTLSLSAHLSEIIMHHSCATPLDMTGLSSCGWVV